MKYQAWAITSQDNNQMKTKLGTHPGLPKNGNNCSLNQSLTYPNQLECTSMIATCLSQTYLKWPNCLGNSTSTVLKMSPCVPLRVITILPLCRMHISRMLIINALVDCIHRWWSFVGLLLDANRYLLCKKVKKCYCPDALKPRRSWVSETKHWAIEHGLT